MNGAEYPPEPEEDSPIGNKPSWMLAMLAAQLPLDDDENWDFEGAYSLWEGARRFLDEWEWQPEETLPLEEALKEIGTSISSWKDTVRRKMLNCDFSGERIRAYMAEWEKAQEIPLWAIGYLKHTSSGKQKKQDPPF